ncbi:hypothetical protein ACNI3K_10625 [Demequina sp. SO4-13]|uniref:hypothetical protein n=1 Tax=Demequina sp. SO4-13 TaxID=3401027 RepID=UPI003AF5B1CB
MPLDHEHASHERVPSRDDHDTPELEDDQTVAPRPEEEVADALRSEPDLDDHGNKSE